MGTLNGLQELLTKMAASPDGMRAARGIVSHETRVRRCVVCLSPMNAPHDHPLVHNECKAKAICKVCKHVMTDDEMEYGYGDICPRCDMEGMYDELHSATTLFM